MSTESPSPGTSSPAPPSIRRPPGGIPTTSLIAIAVLAVLLVIIVRQATGGRDMLAAAINPREHQAVFLTNGQVYFGDLSAPGGDFYYLRHVYYLASQRSPQSGKRPRQTLIKLGKEIHGPEDLMVVNRSQILFVENLKSSGQVSQAIKRSRGH